MCLSNKFLVFISLLTLASTQLVAAPPENLPPIEIDAFVTNGTENPVPIILPTPVQGNTGGTSGSQTATVYTVPDGQRLSIEYLTASGTKSGNQTRVIISIKTTLDSLEVNHYITSLTDFDNSGGFGESRVVQLFADPNTDVILRVSDGNTGAPVQAWSGTIAGRLEPVPGN